MHLEWSCIVPGVAGTNIHENPGYFNCLVVFSV